MTAEEILNLVAAFVGHRFSHPPHDVTVFLAMQAAVHQVVNERDEALAECARMREQYSDQLEEARMEYVKHRAECDARGEQQLDRLRR